ncbi:response regulator transcription factor [Streptomyces geranii]|uniref:response regulator transcription factor n=1 Tax=Streptomyces geranii TaxID=2058923 RepID=UPI001E35975B|nr:helix-turn-helix transcriptional regulator [Streptomyces geranii]
MKHEGNHRRVIARNRKENSTADWWAKLTPAEFRVAQLTTQGFTNREISEALYITVSTVEQHLTRTYRKLRIEGRARLAAEYGTMDADDA